MRQINDAGLKLVKEFEGYKDRAYLCPANVWTIGYGHTKGVRQGDRCTQLQATEWLIDDLEEASSMVRIYVMNDLNSNQYSALVSFVFNVGSGAFRRSTMLRKLNAGDYKGAAAQFERWNKGGGKVLAGLTRRRAAERDLFLRKEW